MTEEEWVRSLASDLREVMRRLDPRRQRLLAAAACRAIGVWVDYPAAHGALAAVETFADTGKTKVALRRARQAVQALRESLGRRGADVGRIERALFTVQMATSENAVFGTLEDACQSLALAEGVSDEAVRRRFYPVYRDIASGPAKSIAFPTDWRTSTAVATARGMYESRDFSPMPILADALQDAGCDNDDILNHCRDPQGVHVRGCWVVDLVLGKS